MEQHSVAVAFIGSGAVKNSWRPVIRALQRAGFPSVATAAGANFAMARLVYAGREIWRAGKIKNYRKIRKQVRRNLKDLKGAIASALVDAVAAQEIVARDELSRVLKEVVFRYAERVAVVTTNWEDTVEREVRKLQPFLEVQYLHGSCGCPGEMYLPTEIVDEPYRGKRGRTLLAHRVAEVVRGMQEASKVVLYGLALSPLDAELGQTLASAMNKSSVRLIHVVDPHYVCVAERVASLTDAQSAQGVQIIGSPPDDPGLIWQYTAGTACETCRRPATTV